MPSPEDRPEGKAGPRHGCPEKKQTRDAVGRVDHQTISIRRATVRAMPDENEATVFRTAAHDAAALLNQRNLRALGTPNESRFDEATVPE
jgi:hypothetical protein